MNHYFEQRTTLFIDMFSKECNQRTSNFASCHWSTKMFIYDCSFPSAWDLQRLVTHQSEKNIFEDIKIQVEKKIDLCQITKPFWVSLWIEYIKCYTWTNPDIYTAYTFSWHLTYSLVYDVKCWTFNCPAQSLPQFLSATTLLLKKVLHKSQSSNSTSS